MRAEMSGTIVSVTGVVRGSFGGRFLDRVLRLVIGHLTEAGCWAHLRIVVNKDLVSHNFVFVA